MQKKSEWQDNEEFINRSKKLEEIRALDIIPYPHTFSPTHEAENLAITYEKNTIGTSEDAEKGLTPSVSIAGRMVLFRAMGKNAFAHIQDATGRIQVMFNRDHTALVGYTPQYDSTLSAMKCIEKKFDLGDIIGIEGNLFHTQKGELTIFVKKVTLLCKSLLPLADKHSGLHDKELRYRKRWLDLIGHADVKNTFLNRSKIIRLVREHFDSLDFLEVETPVLQSIYGGAQAQPFITKLNALDQTMFLRISLEIPLKKLLIGGIGRIFEIGKVFRNEGIDRTHNPEFTMLEAYASYWDYNDMMHLMETLFEKVALALHNTTIIPIYNPETGQTIHIDMKTPWKRLTMKESIKEYAHFDVDALSIESMHDLLKESGQITEKDLAGATKGLLMQHLFEVFVEHHLIQPHHIIDHPIETTPLCKLHRDPQQSKQGIIERFESFILGAEFCNAYSELNDPELQRTLLEQQAARLAAGDREANPLDEEFLEAMAQGMPPAGGIGIGIDRMVMLFTNSHSIRDVLYFPWMRPIGGLQ